MRQHFRAGEIGKPKTEIKRIGHNRLDDLLPPLNAVLVILNGSTSTRTGTILFALLTAMPRVVTIRCCFVHPPHSRPRRLAWPRTSPFHGGNTGSNPVGDANLFNDLQIPSRIWYVR